MEIFAKCFGGSNGNKEPSTTIEQLCHRFSLPQLQKSTDNFDESRSSDGEASAIRIVHFKNEILLLCQLHHPNLISLIGFCDEKEEKMVVYEYMPNRSLSDQLYKRDSHSNSPVLPWKKRLEISIGAARGLHYLHTGAKNTILHRNIKLKNILLDENLVPKLTSLAFSFKGQKFSSKPKPIEVDLVIGTHGYMAPEYMMLGRVSDKLDVFSFGVVLVELVCGKTPSKIFQIIWEEMEKDQNNNTVDVSENDPNIDTSDEDDQYTDESEDDQNGRKIHSWHMGKGVKNIVERGNGERIIDPNLVGKIGAECWKVYIDIAEPCLNEDENERPAMGEVEVELERALELQEQAEANNELLHPNITSN
ncbi:receptor-like protein kinase ANXUR1 [Senna tora]|uniref:Receptor-like protein kinase ANXUR1 n=1 Tax=Senna tora TaxID=362788 RepID=A0A834TEF5_9FABA|nr:receptor-like protein kinase ANXUR1 [Senna tora]